MCARLRSGRAARRLRMSLSGFWLHHGLRGGCAAPETEAVAGATPLFRCLPWHLRRLGCAFHPTLRGGRSEAAIPCGKANGRAGSVRPGLGRRCRTAQRRPAGRPTDAPPRRGGAQPPSGTDRWTVATPRAGAGVRKPTRPRTCTEPSARWVATDTSRVARVPRSGAASNQKTLPCLPIGSECGAHRRGVEVRIGTPCRMRAPVRS